MSHAKQRKLDTFKNNPDVLTTSMVPECTSSSNISEESNAEIDDDSTTLASSSAGCHSFVTLLPQKF